jgi:hypothetical protein
MDARVVPYANQNGLGYYDGLKGFDVINKISPNLAKFLAMAQNKNFINWTMTYGIKIFDIGAAGPTTTSVFYQMEQNLLGGYANLFKVFLP